MTSRAWTQSGQTPIEVVGDCLQDAMDGLKEAERFLAPSPRERIGNALSGLYLVTARRSESDQDRNAVITIMAEKLRRYPIDLVLRAIDDYRGEFFPKLEEIRGPIENGSAYRRRLMVRRAFQEAVQRLTLGATAEKQILPEEREAVRNGFRRLSAELRGMVENVSRETRRGAAK